MHKAPNAGYKIFTSQGEQEVYGPSYCAFEAERALRPYYALLGRPNRDHSLILCGELSIFEI